MYDWGIFWLLNQGQMIENRKQNLNENDWHLNGGISSIKYWKPSNRFKNVFWLEYSEKNVFEEFSPGIRYVYDNYYFHNKLFVKLTY